MNLPTKITVARIFMAVLLVISLFVLSLIPDLRVMNIEIGKSSINLVFLIIFVVFLIASYTDHLDGKIARKRNLITPLGKFLDPVADKLLVNSMLILLACPSIFAPYANSQIYSINIWCVILLICRDLVVDALRFIAAEKNVVIAANIFGKMKTVLEMVTICIVLLNGFPFTLINAGIVTDILVYLTTFVSVLSGVIYVYQNKNVLKEDK